MVSWPVSSGGLLSRRTFLLGTATVLSTRLFLASFTFGVVISLPWNASRFFQLDSKNTFHHCNCEAWFRPKLWNIDHEVKWYFIYVFFSFYHFTALETKPHWTLFQILCCNRSHVEVEKESALCTISGKYGTNHFMATFLKLRNWPLLLRRNGLSRSIFAKRCIYSISLRKLRNGPLVQTMPKFSFTDLSIQWLLCITPWLIHNHYHKWVQSSF